jgi:hypothetical protein
MARGRRVTQAKQDEIAARRTKVATLRLAHLTQPEIAAQLGVGIGTVNRDLQAIRQEWAQRRDTAYEDWLAEELAKLDRLERALLPLALQGSAPVADRILSIMDRRARMMGLDKPTRAEVTVDVRSDLDREIAELLDQLDGETADGRPVGVRDAGEP